MTLIPPSLSGPVPAQAVAEGAKKRDRSVRIMQTAAGTCGRAETSATGLSFYFLVPGSGAWLLLAFDGPGGPLGPAMKELFEAIAGRCAGSGEGPAAVPPRACRPARLAAPPRQALPAPARLPPGRSQPRDLLLSPGQFLRKLLNPVLQPLENCAHPGFGCRLGSAEGAPADVGKPAGVVMIELAHIGSHLRQAGTGRARFPRRPPVQDRRHR
jgi:hypothetical protein